MGWIHETEDEMSYVSPEQEAARAAEAKRVTDARISELEARREAAWAEASPMPSTGSVELVDWSTGDSRWIPASEFLRKYPEARLAQDSVRGPVALGTKASAGCGGGLCYRKDGGK